MFVLLDPSPYVQIDAFWRAPMRVLRRRAECVNAYIRACIPAVQDMYKRVCIGLFQAGFQHDSRSVPIVAVGRGSLLQHSGWQVLNDEMM